MEFFCFFLPLSLTWLSQVCVLIPPFRGRNGSGAAYMLLLRSAAGQTPPCCPPLSPFLMQLPVLTGFAHEFDINLLFSHLSKGNWTSSLLFQELGTCFPKPSSFVGRKGALEMLIDLLWVEDYRMGMRNWGPLSVRTWFVYLLLIFKIMCNYEKFNSYLICILLTHQQIIF